MPKRPPIVDGDVVRIPLTRGLFATVDPIDADLGDYTWTAAKRHLTWYAYRQVKKTVLYLHRVIAERAGIDVSGLEVDHRDGDGLNCRRKNLRAATHAQNASHAGKRRNNKSGFKGVVRRRDCDRWTAEIRTPGKKHYLGIFPSAAEAATAYAEAAKRLHGEFAKT